MNRDVGSVRTDVYTVLTENSAFKASLRAQGAEPWVLENVAMAFDQMAERIERLAR